MGESIGSDVGMDLIEMFDRFAAVVQQVKEVLLQWP